MCMCVWTGSLRRARYLYVLLFHVLSFRDIALLGNCACGVRVLTAAMPEQSRCLAGPHPYFVRRGRGYVCACARVRVRVRVRVCVRVLTTTVVALNIPMWLCVFSPQHCLSIHDVSQALTRFSCGVGVGTYVRARARARAREGARVRARPLCHRSCSQKSRRSWCRSPPSPHYTCNTLLSLRVQLRVRVASRFSSMSRSSLSARRCDRFKCAKLL